VAPTYDVDARFVQHRPQLNVEPYVIAADVSTSPLHVGAAGWIWYTGSAAWMYRLGIEMLLGLPREEETLPAAGLHSRYPSCRMIRSRH
jgi:cellobiose phosphorylase